MFRLSLACIGAASLASAVEMPDFLVLSAPWTPFNSNGSINTAPVKNLAPQFKQSGVNTVWVVGGMGQFDTMTVEDRNTMTQVWTDEGHKEGLFVIAHVGSVVQADAISLAKSAVTIGADAIAAVPPYYEGITIPLLIDWLEPILAQAPHLPFFYYHIPGETKVDIAMHDLISAIQTSKRLPNFKGVKYVDADIGDFFNVVTDPAMQEFAMLWAPEPKLQSFAFPGRGTILAESFYAGTFLRMWDTFNKHDMAASRAEMKWKYSAEATFSKYASMSGTSSTVAKRAVYQALCAPGIDCDIGLPRQPQTQVPLQAQHFKDMVAELTQIGFFNQTIPKWTPPAN